ncbi:MAG: TRAP transporter substrate-binding protein DctP [Syntrophobacterales bacterium]|nr:TRAP transporter substrate-binding protein DctP [Syntrophobacterales bacterium]
MKRLLIVLSVMLFLVLLSLPVPGSAGVVKKKYTLHLATQMPLTHTITKAAMVLAQRAAELSRNKINVVVHAGGAMFSDRQIPDATMSGGCDIGISTSNTWAKYVRGMSFWEVPFLIPPSVSVDKLAEATIPIFDKTLETKGGKLLGYAYYGYEEGIATTKVQLKRPVDVKGLKLRIYDRTHLPGFKAFGAAPVVMSSKEVYIGLQRGVLDGAVSGLSSINHRKWFEVCKYVIAIPNLVSCPSHPFPIAVNLNVWKGMEPAAQKILLQAATEAGRFTHEEVKKMVVKDLKTLRDSKAQVYELKAGSPEWNEWKNALGPAGKKKFLADNPKAGPVLIKMIKSLE